MKRRWHSNQRARISGVNFRVDEGSKAAGEGGDLRLMVQGSDGRWRPAHMALAFFCVDFYAENEDSLRPARPWWSQNGQRYFLSKCIQAVRDGWQNVADEIERQRA